MKKWESLAARITRAQQLIRETRAASSKYRSKWDTQARAISLESFGVWLA
jgi:hypothetical protein